MANRLPFIELSNFIMSKTTKSNLDIHKCFMALSTFGYTSWYTMIMIMLFLQDEYIYGMALLCLTTLFLLFGRNCRKSNTKWLIFIMVNHLTNTFMVFQFVFEKFYDDHVVQLVNKLLKIQSFVIVYLILLSLTMAMQNNVFVEYLICVISIFYIYSRHVAFHMLHIDPPSIALTTLQIMIGVIISVAQKQIHTAQMRQFEERIVRLKDKNTILKKILKFKLGPFFWLEEFVPPQEPTRSRFSLDLSQPLKQKPQDDCVQLSDTLNVGIVMKGVQNLTIFREEDKLEDIFLSSSVHTLSLIQQINMFCEDYMKQSCISEFESIVLDDCQLMFVCPESSRQASQEIEQQLNLQRKESYVFTEKKARNSRVQIKSQHKSDQNSWNQSHSSGLVHEKRKKQAGVMREVPFQRSPAGKMSEISEYLTKRDEKLYSIDMAAFSIRGRRSFIVLFRENMTQFYEQRIQDLQIQDRNKDDILASVSHDFKTPINGMVALVDAVIKSMQVSESDRYKKCSIICIERQGSPQHQSASTQLTQYSIMLFRNLYYMEIIKKNILLLLYMIADIQDYSKMQKGELRVSPCSFQIQQIVLEVIELMAIQAESKKIEIKYQINVSNNGEMRSDPNRIKQILFNLVSNALKFTLRGYIMIKVHQEGNTNLLRISVSDTGIGIPDDVRFKLFKMYSTFDQKGLNKNGVGLGLVICKNLVALLGPSPTITLESGLNLGTTFTFKIYMKLPDLDISGRMSSHVQFKHDDHSKQSMHSSSMYIFSKKNIQNSNKFIILPNPIDFNQSAMMAYNDGKPSITDECLPHDDDDATVVKNVVGHQLEAKKSSVHPHSSLSTPRAPIEIHKQQRLLVVDDEPFNVIAIKVMCRDPRLWIDEAYNGQEALMKVRSQADQGIFFDYIFLDLTMPIMNGYDTAKAIRDHVQKQHIPRPYLVAISGYDDPKERETCIELGFDAFLPKPVTSSMIRQIIK